MNVCPYCGHDYRAVPGPATKPKTYKPVIGGVLIMIAGILALGMGILFLMLGPGDIEASGYTPASGTDISLSELESILGTCGIIEIVIGAIAVVGGIFAVSRRNFGLAIAGGIFGMIGIGFVAGAVLGLIGLILVAMSRSEF